MGRKWISDVAEDEVEIAEDAGVNACGKCVCDGDCRGVDFAGGVLVEESGVFAVGNGGAREVNGVREDDFYEGVLRGEAARDECDLVGC